MNLIKTSRSALLKTSAMYSDHNKTFLHICANCTEFENIWSLCTHYYITIIIFVIINWPEYERWQSRQRHARTVQAEYTHDQPLVVSVLIAHTHFQCYFFCTTATMICAARWIPLWSAHAASVLIAPVHHGHMLRILAGQICTVTISTEEYALWPLV